MHLRRMIVMLAAAASLSLGLPQTMSAASAAPAVHPTAGVPTPAKAAAASTAQNGSDSVSFLSPGTRGSSPNGARTPFIQFRECSGQTTTWVDMDFITGAGLQDWCFGYAGTWQFTATNDVSNFCSGNNSGVYVYSQNGVLHNFRFGPGRYVTFAANVRVYSLSIASWSGSHTCIS
jgi:hypothetical protein